MSTSGRTGGYLHTRYHLTCRDTRTSEAQFKLSDDITVTLAQGDSLNHYALQLVSTHTRSLEYVVWYHCTKTKQMNILHAISRLGKKKKKKNLRFPQHSLIQEVHFASSKRVDSDGILAVVFPCYSSCLLVICQTVYVFTKSTTKSGK